MIANLNLNASKLQVVSYRLSARPEAGGCQWQLQVQVKLQVERSLRYVVELSSCSSCKTFKFNLKLQVVPVYYYYYYY